MQPSYFIFIFSRFIPRSQTLNFLYLENALKLTNTPQLAEDNLFGVLCSHTVQTSNELLQWLIGSHK